MKSNISEVMEITYPQEERYFKLRGELLDYFLNIKDTPERVFEFGGRELFISYVKTEDGGKYTIELEEYTTSSVCLSEMSLDLELDVMLFAISKLEAKLSAIQYN